MTAQQKYERIHELEWELTKLAVNCEAGGLQIPDSSTYKSDRLKALALADAIEDFSEGKNKVLFDALNRPSVFYVVKPDKMARTDVLSKGSTLFSAPSNHPVHPAFLVNDKMIKTLYLPKYEAGRSEGVNYPVSLYGLFPAHTISYDSAVALCKTGAGVSGQTAENNLHMMTQTELGYLLCLSAYHNFECDGNDNYGRPYNRKDDYGQPAMCDATEETPNRHIGRVACGSMSMHCNHDGSPFGIQLRSGCSIWKGGYTTYGGEIRVGKNNNFACPWADHSLNSSWWKTFIDGNLWGGLAIDESMKWDFVSTPANNGAYQLAKTITNRGSGVYGYKSFASLGSAEGVTIPELMRLYGIMPLLANNPKGGTWMRNDTDLERVAYELGSWGSTSNAGWGYSSGDDCSRSNTGGSVGFAVASYEQETNI